MVGADSVRVVACTAVLTLAGMGVIVACGGSNEPAGESAAATTPEPETEAIPSTLELSGAGGHVELTIEVSDSASERGRGLSGREALEAGHGMLFVNDENVTTGFQMEGTTIPLSLAFIAEDGTILEIIDMEPCIAAPCDAYAPPGPYRAALEVNQGAFVEWEIVAGDLALLPTAG